MEDIDYKKEYIGLVNELVRHMTPVGRMVKLQAFYRVGSDPVDPAIKLSESPFIYRALLAAGSIEGQDSNGFRTLKVPYGQYGLSEIKEEKGGDAK